MAAPQWHFEDFRLDPVNARLWRGAEPLALPPKVFHVLHYLVTHSDQLVTKDELLDTIWPNTTVTDAVVRVAIGTLRKALDDTRHPFRFIATVPRRGYRFLTPVTVVDTPELAPAGVPLRRATPAPPLQRAEASVPERAPLASTPTSLVEKILTSRAGLEGERKQVTVLFADITDSLALIRSLDPEAAQQLLDPALHAMMDAVHRYEGTVNQVLGDGIMALFGAPI